MQLYTHQQRNIQSLVASLGKYGAALDASDVGTGKTLTAVGLCKHLSAQPAIVCPLAVIPSWQKACADLGVTPVFITNYEQVKSAKFPFATFTREVVKDRNGTKRKKLTLEYRNIPTRTLFIFDEVQRCRAQKSENSFLLLQTAKKYKVLLLSATPFTTPLEAYPIGYSLRLFSMDGYYSWMVHHGVRKNFFNHWEYRGGVEMMEAIHRDMFPERGVRTRREEIPGFPQSQISADAIGVPEPDEINRSYLDELALAEQKDIERARADVAPELWDLITPIALTRDLRSRQRAELLKVPVMADMAKDAMEKGLATAVFLNFDASICLFRQYIDTKCIVSGNMSFYDTNASRYQAIENFRHNRSNIILVNSAAGGTGLNLHDEITKVPRQALISPPLSAVVLRQVLGRVHRAAGGWSRQQILFAAGTIEERVMNRLNERLNNLDALTDGDLDPMVLDQPK